MTKATKAASEPSVSAIVDAAEAAEESNKSKNQWSDPEYKRRLLSLQNYRFKDLEDVIEQFPFPDELEAERRACIPGKAW